MANVRTRAGVNLSAVIVGALCALTSIACGKTVQEMDLQPAKLFTDFKLQDDEETAYLCPLNGLGCAPPANVATAGFYNQYNAGTEPFACWQWVGCFYRGFVAFDLAPLSGKGIVSAELQWTNKTEKATGSVATNEGHCLKSVFVATGPWDGFVTPGDPLFTDLQSKQAAEMSLEVGPTVRAWALGQQPNHGFFVVGTKESFTPRSSDVCATTLQTLRLHVRFTE